MMLTCHKSRWSLVVQTLKLSVVFHIQAEHNTDTPMFQNGGYMVHQAQSNRKLLFGAAKWATVSS